MINHNISWAQAKEAQRLEQIAKAKALLAQDKESGLIKVILTLVLWVGLTSPFWVLYLMQILGGMK